MLMKGSSSLYPLAHALHVSLHGIFSPQNTIISFILLFIYLPFLHSVDSTGTGKSINSSVWLEKQKTQNKVAEL